MTDALNALGRNGFAELVEDINTHSTGAGFESAKDLVHGVPITLEDVIATVNTNRQSL